jgi:hypothetical protein
MARPPFDPVRGAWILILALIATVAANTAFLFVGCAILQVQAMCERTGNKLRDVALELITAVAVLLSQRRP